MSWYVRIDRAVAATVDALGPIGTRRCTKRLGGGVTSAPSWQPIQQDTRIAGSAVTVLSHPGDNMMLHAAVEVCQPGDLLVVATTAPSTHGMFGDLLATSLMVRGVRGLVIDAAVRDTADLRVDGFPSLDTPCLLPGHGQATPGSVNVPITLAEKSSRPAMSSAPTMTASSSSNEQKPTGRSNVHRRRIAKEEETRAMLEAGELASISTGLRSKLAELGVEYIDRPLTITFAFLLRCEAALARSTVYVLWGVPLRFTKRSSLALTVTFCLLASL